MDEEQNGQFGGSGLNRVTLDQIARADKVRERQHDRHIRTVNKRNGNKGARRWGFMTPGSGKRK